MMESEGSASITASHVPTDSRPARIISPSAHTSSASAGIELRAGPTARERRGRIGAADTVGDLDELRQLRQPCRHRHRLALGLAGPAVAVPLLVGPSEGGPHRIRQSELLGQQSRHRGVLGDHAVQLVPAGEHELEADPEAVQGRVARAQQPQRRGRPAQAPELMVVLARLEGDVVAEPLRLLVGVGVAADVDQEGGVVDDRALLVREPDPLGQAQGDQALAEHVLHGLAEAEVDAERERGDELRQPGVRAIGPTRHMPSLPQAAHSTSKRRGVTTARSAGPTRTARRASTSYRQQTM